MTLLQKLLIVSIRDIRKIIMRFQAKGIRYVSYAFMIAVYGYIYRQWLFSTAILTSGDWQFYFKDTLATVRINYFSIWLSDSSFGRVLIDAGQAPTYALYGFLAQYFGLNYNIAERVVSMIPVIIVTPIGAYMLAQHIFKFKPASALAAVVYSFNTYILTLQTGDLTLAGPYAIAPLIIYSYISLLNKPSLRKIIISGLLLAVSTAYEPRGTYVTMIAVGIYIVCKLGFTYVQTRKIKQAVSLLFISGLPLVLLGLLNVFWILALSHTANPSGSVLGEGLFGSQYFKLSNALTIFQPYWSGSMPVAFVTHPVPFYFWLTPVAAFSSLYFFRKNRYVLLFGLVSLTGIVLSKQADNPIAGLYGWLYLHLPGFNAFREASKFYALTALGYSMLTAALVAGLFKNNIFRYSKQLSWASLAILSGIFLFNTIPIATGTIETLFVSRHVPAAEAAVNEYINRQPGYFRTLWLPTTTRWIDYTNEHPAESMVGLINSSWSKLIGYKPNSIVAPTNQQLVKIFNASYINHLLDSGSIKYIVVPSRDIANDNDFYVHFGNDRQFFVDTLNKVAGLKHVDIGVQGIDVYENTTYSQYAYAAPTISHLQSLENLDQDYSFISRNLLQSDNFTTDDVGTNANDITPLFDKIPANNIVKGSVLSSQTQMKNSAIYSNTNALKISYKYSSNEIKIYSQRNSSLNSPGQINASQVIGDVVADSTGASYAIADNDRVTALINSPRLRTFDSTPSVIQILKTTSANLVVNPSLENGLWQRNVSDCNAYDSNASIGQSLSNDSTAGQHSLELVATNHTACTSPNNIGVLGGQRLWLQFDFKVFRGKEAGYQLIFNDANHTQQKNYLPISDGNWTNVSRLVEVPKGATSLKLVVEAFPNDSSPYRGIALYDNFSLKTVTSMFTANIDNKPNFIASSSNSTDKIAYNDLSIDGNNLIPNSQFKNGLWQKKVGDCNAYDNKSSIGMSLNSKAGANYLQLSARKHIACTGPDAIKINEGQSYALNFRYQSPNASFGGYSIKFNDANRTLINNDQLQTSNHKWNDFSSVFKVPYGATSAQLTFYSYSDESSGQVTYINRYSDFSLKQVPDVANNYYAVKRAQSGNSVPANISSRQTSPTDKTIDIKGAKTPFYLIMAETYNPGWKLKLNTVSSMHAVYVINEGQHYEMNGFENGWYIDINQLCKVKQLCTVNSDGTYNINFVAQFAPQHYMDIGLTVSGGTLLICLGYLGYSFIVNRVRPKKKAY